MPREENVGGELTVSTIRSQLMARIRGRDTSPERILRKELWLAGLRYRVNHPTSAGRPDIVFPRQRIAIFVDGCFWHGCPNHYVRPRSRCDFWTEKLRVNFERDCRQSQVLENEGWKVYRVWEHEVFESLPSVVAQVQRLLTHGNCQPFESWRVTRVDVVDAEIDLEKRYLQKLRNPHKERIITAKRTTEKWRRPS